MGKVIDAMTVFKNLRKMISNEVRQLRQLLETGVLCLGAFITTEAAAGCPQGQEAFTSCQIEGRNTEVFVCFDDQVATYSYGPIGGPPELFLSESIERVDFEPWSGLGRAISESVTFYNEEYGYDVGGGFDRPFTDEEASQPLRRFGWVEVTESGQRAASLECIPDTVSYGFGGGIHDAKVAAGLSWDWDSKTWVSDAIRSSATPVLQEASEFGLVYDCLPETEFSLDGVKMGDPLSALGKLGTPERIDQGSFSDEIVDRMSLVGADIDFFQDVVVTMTATSPKWQMPSGLRVGLTRGDVVSILGRVPNGSKPTSQRFYIDACSEGSEDDDDFSLDQWFVLIDFGQDKRVSRMTLLTATQ